MLFKAPWVAPPIIPRAQFLTSATVSVLMASSQSSSNPPVKKPSQHGGSRWKDPRDALGPYTTHPDAFPPTSVIFHNANFVYVRDLFPKSQVHTLLLPRDQSKTRLHPFEAFEDAVFLQSVKDEAARLKRLVAAELKRMFGDQNGRDWEKEVKVGVHARPSMNHLHVHVMSREHCSERLKTAQHYSEYHHHHHCYTCSCSTSADTG
jgi:aprataxin